MDLGAGIWASKLGSEPRVFEYGILALRMGFGLLRLGFRPRDKDKASKLGFELGEGGTAKKKSRKEKKKDKIPHMCESIGHRPLLGRRPKGLETIEISQV